MAFHLKYLIFSILLIFSSCSTYAEYPESDFSTKVSASWTNNPSSRPSYVFSDGSMFRSIFSKPMKYPSFGFGFYCNGNCASFVLSIIAHSPLSETQSAEVVWSSNRNHPVTENATLYFTWEDGLILKDADGTFVWSTNITGRSFQSLNLTRMGNLVLYGTENQILWQSYDHPTDTLVSGQKLLEEQRLVASVSRVNWNEGAFSFYINSVDLIAYVTSHPQHVYYERAVGDSGVAPNPKPSYLELRNGGVVFYDAEHKKHDLYAVPPTQFIQYMKLDSDGHFRVYQWGHTSSNIMVLKEAADLFSDCMQRCDYPLACGQYGICTGGNCSCPASGCFRPEFDGQKTVGCLETIPLSCEYPQHHQFLDLDNVSYFHIFFDGIHASSIDTCKQACVKNCSCKGGFFVNAKNDMDGDCYLHSEVFSLVSTTEDYLFDYKAFIKVQITPNVSDLHKHFLPPTDAPQKGKWHGTELIRFTLVTSFIFLSLIMSSYVLLRITKNFRGKHESYKDLLSGTPRRFTYEELKTATKNFRRKLGEGGSGSVYEGALTDGTKVAVKRLDGLIHMRRSFLAEVEILGKVHHVNLVKLIGFCSEKSHRLLVYEYMCNGSLDKWIFHKADATLDWKTQKNIIRDVAKGLAYLHEECIEKILHLDIKPQNILLDEKCNAKLSDFGLSKLMGKDKSKIITSMRGTPGYLAPEWLNSMITDKADVYSFGIVVLEILSGRRNLDIAQPEHCLYDIFDNHCEDMLLHKDEVMEMLKVAVWCLQSDFSKRPSMSLVLDLLDGVRNIEPNLALSFFPALPTSQ